VRSIRKPQKQKQLLEYFVQSDLDILNVQETWLDTPFVLPAEYQKRVRVMHTQPKTSMGEGLLVLTRYKDMNIQGALELLWSSWLMVTVIHKAVGPDLKKIVNVNFYRPQQ
jgi:hypothetical protein